MRVLFVNDYAFEGGGAERLLEHDFAVSLFKCGAASAHRGQAARTIEGRA